MRPSHSDIIICLGVCLLTVGATGVCSRESADEQIAVTALTAPALQPDSAVFAESIVVEVQAPANESAVLFYTTDGSDPAVEGIRYTKPIVLRESAVLRAVATSSDDAHYNSPQVQGAFVRVTPRLPKPIITPADTNLRQPVAVALAAPANAPASTIYYTIDGTEPDSSKKRYDKPLVVEKSCVVRAIALREGYASSDIRAAQFVFDSSRVVAAPTASIAGDRYRGGIPPIALACATEKTMITYTLDGSEPTAASALWDGEPILLDRAATLKARAFRTDWVGSATLTETYELEQLPSPVVTPSSGTVFADSLTLAFTVPGFEKDSLARIMIQPANRDSLHQYLQPMVIRASGKYRVFADRSGYRTSDTVFVAFHRIHTIAAAWYTDSDGDGAIETAFVRLHQPALSPPSIVELSLSEIEETRRCERNAISPAFQRADTAQKGSATYRIHINPPFQTGGLSKQMTGRIPLAGEYDTRPFILEDRAGPIITSVLLYPGAAGGYDTLRITFNEPVTLTRKAILAVDALRFFDQNGSQRRVISDALLTADSRNSRVLYSLTDAGLRDAVTPGRAGVRIAPQAPLVDSSGANSVVGSIVPVRAGAQFPVAVRAKTPFTPGVDMLPEAIRALSGVQAQSATAVVIESGAPIRGSGIIFDAVGNRVFEQRELVRDPASNRLYLIWDGTNKAGRRVAPGTYLAAVTIHASGWPESIIQTEKIGVR